MTRRPNVWRLAWRVTQHRPAAFWVGWGLFVLFFTFPVLNGWLLGRGFHALQQGHTTQVYWFAAAALLVDAIRMATIHWGALVWTRAFVHMQSFLVAPSRPGRALQAMAERKLPVG